MLAARGGGNVKSAGQAGEGRAGKKNARSPRIWPPPFQTIRVDLAALDPAASVQRLLRFVDSHASLFGRIDDSSGRIQEVTSRRVV
jgi:hypothetical protein